MKLSQRPQLASLTTFGVKAEACVLLRLEHEEDLLAAPVFDPKKDFVLGGGSNVLLVDDVPGTVYLNDISGIEIVEENASHVLVEAGAGESWHELVSWAVEREYCGIENLALIPGKAGAAPIQNIGAYGVELSNVLDSVTAWDWQSASWSILDNAACRFAYRDSLFKSASPGRYFITSIRLRLSKTFQPQLSYAGLEQELGSSPNHRVTPLDVFRAVVRLRQRKLPDPAVHGNAGSFFKNPVIKSSQAEGLLGQFPGLPCWRQGHDEYKVSAAWLIEHCGLKGFERDGAAVSKQHALVLVNKGSATGQAVWELAMLVQSRVEQMCGLLLEAEPRIYRAASA